MTDILTNIIEERPVRAEILTGPEQRLRTPAEQMRFVEEPGMTVSRAAPQHGIAPNQLFTWRRLAAHGALTAAGVGVEVVPASEYRALQAEVREAAFRPQNRT